MICKSKGDLFRERGRVEDMCVGTMVDPALCVRLEGVTGPNGWRFSDPPKNYTFALAIVEDRAVWQGDVLYTQHSSGYTLRGAFAGDDFTGCSWNPPKPKTFTLNGEELPMPTGQTKGLSTDPRYRLTLDGYSWENSEDRSKVVQAFIKLLEGK